MAFRIGFAVSGVTESNYSQVVDFIVTRLLRLQEFSRESLETTLKKEDYIYFYPGITDEEIASAPCTVFPVIAPGNFYKNIHDFRLECPVSYNITFGYQYQIVKSGRYVISTDERCIRILDKEFVGRKLLAKPTLLPKPDFDILLQESGYAILQENGSFILIP